MRTELVRTIDIRTATLGVVLLGLLPVSACFSARDPSKVQCLDDSSCTSPAHCSKAANETTGRCLTGATDASADGGPIDAAGSGGKGTGGAGSGGTGSGGTGSGGAGNDASVIDAPGQDPSKCKLDMECSTGHCVDGVCCDTSCDGQCESCKEAGSVGVCKAIKGTPVGPRDACGGTGMCMGQCDGTNGKTCTFPDSTTICTAATCASGTVTTASVCNSSGSCSASQSSACPNSQCATDGTAKCATSCTASSCASGYYCDTTGVCLQGQANGSSCSVGATCASGYCADGVCCDGKCDGQCQSCKEAGSMGKCIALKGAPLPTRTACGGTGICKGQCDGVNAAACTFPDDSTVCTAATCTGGKATTSSVCNGSGACTTAASSQCTSNLCATDGSGKCSGSCTASSCPSGTYCDSTGTCAKTLDVGASCSVGTQCTSGNCADGVCCDGKCDGQCQSCKESGSVGKCKTIKGDPISPRAACGGTGKCKAQCDGTSATACTYPDGSTQCTPATCSGGKVTTASVCNGSGSCTTSGTNACGSNLCAADGMTCAGSCTATSCAAGTYCGAGGACAPTIADGKVCSADNQCASGNCVSGVCCHTACGACHSCSTGTCNQVSAGTSCSGGVCNSTGTCTACTQGASCTSGITECQTGSYDCSTGTPVCKASNKNAGTQCGNGQTCTGGMQYPHQVCNSSGQCTTPSGISCANGCDSTTQSCVACTMSTAPTSINVFGTLPICSSSSAHPGSVNITVSGGSLGTGARRVWYTSPPPASAGNGAGTGASLTNVSPASTTTYYVRAEGTCNVTATKSVTVTVYSPPQITINPPSQNVDCSIAYVAWTSFTASLSSSSAPPATEQWYYTTADTATKTICDGNYFQHTTTLILGVSPQINQTDWILVTDICGAQAWGSATLTVPDISVCFP